MSSGISTEKAPSEVLLIWQTCLSTYFPNLASRSSRIDCCWCFSDWFLDRSFHEDITKHTDPFHESKTRFERSFTGKNLETDTSCSRTRPSFSCSWHSLEKIYISIATNGFLRCQRKRAGTLVLRKSHTTARAYVFSFSLSMRILQYVLPFSRRVVFTPDLSWLNNSQKEYLSIDHLPATTLHQVAEET